MLIAMKHIDLIADGSCLSHRGPGGRECVLRYRGFERVLTGGSPVTTNNQMELRAVIMGLRALQEPCDVSPCTAGHALEPPQGWPLGNVPRRCSAKQHDRYAS
jgi:ribonuclease HI